jgi:hypothetical protein
MTMLADLERSLAAAAERLHTTPHAEGSPARRRRSWRVPALVAAAVCGSVLVALQLVPGSRTNQALAARTYAALDPRGAMVHFVFDETTRLNGRRIAHIRLERWQLGRSSRTRTTTFSRYNGAIVAEGTSDGRTVREYDGRHHCVVYSAPQSSNAGPLSPNRGPQDPFTNYRLRYQEHGIRDLGPTRIFGTSAHDLRFTDNLRTIDYYVPGNRPVPVAVRVTEVPRYYKVNHGHRGPTRTDTHLSIERLVRVKVYEHLDPAKNRHLLNLLGRAQLPPPGKANPETGCLGHN